MTRKICVVTGTRAEYGLLRWVMKGIDADPALSLQVVATGMHLSPEFGLTYREIERDGLRIDRKVEILLSSDTAVGVAKSMALGVAGLAESFAELCPDVIVLLGDRFEIFAAAAAAVTAKIPIMHIHGGEITEGAFDDAFRHALTKMSYLHCVAAEPYRRRVIQLGESPDRVFLVGGLGIDAIDRVSLLSRDALEDALGFRFGQRNLLVTFHPSTLESVSAADQMNELLAALERFEDIHLIFTLPNADTGGRGIAALIEGFVARRANARSYASLGQLRYFSCMANVDGVVGNSSSGLLEAPTFKKGTVNVGARQQGRLRAASVIDCAAERVEIASAIQRLYSCEFRSILADVTSPYGQPGASNRIIELLRSFPLPESPSKAFYDLPG